MEAAPRWAANVAKIAGALAWGMGALFHMGLLGAINATLHSIASGYGFGFFPSGWDGTLVLLLVVFSGPVAVTVGGGMRFLGGIMSGQKVAGEQAPRIMLFEWLRYEFWALGVASLFGSLWTFSDGSANRPVLCLLLFIGAILLGVASLSLASHFEGVSRRLMANLREDGIRRGDVPYPADAVHSRERFDGTSWNQDGDS